jgi:shikimate dehydrogenase
MDVFGLVGNPVGHSLSPRMHEAAYAEREIDARYVTFEPEPGDIDRVAEGAAALGITGLNVTIPFKEDVLEVVAPDDLAARIGAVNTVDFATDPPTGYNTDATGVTRSFAHHDVPIEGREAVIVGAGGAARAAAFALADAGATIAIANRTVERAYDLAGSVSAASSSEATGHGLDALSGLLPEADLLVNATSVGMEEDRSPVPADALHADLSVLDAVYRPLRTRLLRDAEAAGATTIDGAWMLLYQGVEAFECWTGEPAPIAAMNDALRERL